MSFFLTGLNHCTKGTEAIQTREGALREGGFLYGFDSPSTRYSSSLSQSTNMHVKLMDDSHLVI